MQTLLIDDYPQLSLITWSRPGKGEIREDDAFALYERNWRWVDKKGLTPQEGDLIRRLTDKYGNGVLNV